MQKEKETPFDVLKRMADKDLKIDKSALDSESTRTPMIHNKWVKLLCDRKRRLSVFELKRKILVRDKWLYYTGKASDEVYKEKGHFHLKVMKSEIDMFMQADEDFFVIDKNIAMAKLELEFIQKVCEECNRRSFHISNSLKALAFVNGMN